MSERITSNLLDKCRIKWLETVEVRLALAIFMWILFINIFFYDTMLKVVDYIFSDTGNFYRFYFVIEKIVSILNFPYLKTWGGFSNTLDWLMGTGKTLAIVRESAISALLSTLVLLAGRRFILVIIARIRR